MWDRTRSLGFALALGALASCDGARPLPRDPEARAIAWLVRQQSSDGAWRSQTYKPLEGGVLTPFVLWVLSLAPPDRLEGHGAALARAFQHVDARVEDYPAYGRALWILALVGHRPEGWEERVRRLARDLRRTQLTEQFGWTPADPEYGGWDRGAAPPRKPDSERPDLSLTAFAIEALRAAGAGDADPEIAAARMFVSGCQNAEDGGFFFTPGPRHAHDNKAGRRPVGGHVSYGTATADAVRAMRASGVDPNGRAMTRALAWLEDRFKVDAAPGFSAGGDRWDEALLFYWLFAAARTGEAKWKPAIRTRVLELRQKEGFWRNANPHMKEDDPIIATGLALAAYWLSR